MPGTWQDPVARVSLPRDAHRHVAPIQQPLQKLNVVQERWQGQPFPQASVLSGHYKCQGPEVWVYPELKRERTPETPGAGDAWPGVGCLLGCLVVFPLRSPMLELPRLFLLYLPSSSFYRCIAAQGWALSSQSPSFALLSQALEQSPREGFCFHPHPHPHQASAFKISIQP